MQQGGRACLISVASRIDILFQATSPGPRRAYPPPAPINLLAAAIAFAA